MAIEIFDRITVDPEVCHGKPCIKGTRIFISIILDWLSNGHSFEEIIDAYPTLVREDIISVIEYSKQLVEYQNQLLNKYKVSM